jgi:cysteine desulfurase
MKEIYLDNSATTACFPEVAEKMSQIMTQDYGNPSSMHHKGLVAENYLREAREKIAKTLKADEKEILFTSGGTESDNLALIGTARTYARKGRHLITSAIEHPAILETMKYLEGQGYTVTYLPVDSAGHISLDSLREAMTPDTVLVSLMHTNNEIGSLTPVEEAGKLIKSIDPEVIFHVDAVQGYGKSQIIPHRENIDLLSVSAHKIHGPKGVGFLYHNAKTRLEPMIFGGGQQKGLRSGTENTAGIYGMAMAAEKMYADLEGDRARLYGLKARLIDGLTSLPGVSINGLTGTDSAPHIVSASVSGVRSEVLLHALEDKGVYISAGSACSSNRPHISETLKAIGVARELLDSTLRFSMSVMTTEEDIDAAVEAFRETVPVLRKYSRQ